MENENQRSDYDRIAERVIAAVAELNAAMREAADCADMAVTVGQSKGMPMQLQHRIYKLTHATVTYEFQVRRDGKDGKVEEGEWRPVDKFYRSETHDPMGT